MQDREKRESCGGGRRCFLAEEKAQWGALCEAGVSGEGDHVEGSEDEGGGGDDVGDEGEGGGGERDDGAGVWGGDEVLPGPGVGALRPVAAFFFALSLGAAFLFGPGALS